MGRLQRIFRDSQTLVITPSKVYDFTNEDQQVMTDIEMVFANYEYRMIKKRFKRGKQHGARAGKWTNGTPPLPYVYDRRSRSLVVDSEKLKIYQLIKRMLLDEMKSPHYIARELNRLGFQTNRQNKWSDIAVKRLLTSPIHLGLIVYGRTSGWVNRHGARRIIDTEPIVAEGTHAQLKTEDEHQRILSILESRRMKPRKGSKIER